MPELPNTLIHWPRQPPQGLLGVYGRETPLQKPKSSDETTSISPAISESVVMQESQTGKLFHGLRDSRGFIVKESASRAAQRQIFEEDTLDAWNKARPTVIKHIQQRQWLCEQPLTTASPDQWLTTSQSTHTNVLPAVKADTREHSFVDPYPRTHHSSLKRAHEKPAAPAENREELKRYAHEFRLRDAAMADLDSLRETLKLEQRKGIVVSRKGNSLKDCNRDVQSRSLTPNVFELCSTTHSTYLPYDALDPEQTALRLDVDDPEEEFIRHKLTVPRYVDTFSTTHSDSFMNPSVHDPSGEMSPTVAYRKSHHFDKIQSTRQMPRLHRELVLSPNNFQHTRVAAEILPSQFTTSSVSMSASLKSFNKKRSGK